MFCKEFWAIILICYKMSICNLTKNNTPLLAYFIFLNGSRVADPETRHKLKPSHGIFLKPHYSFTTKFISKLNLTIWYYTWYTWHKWIYLTYGICTYTHYVHHKDEIFDLQNLQILWVSWTVLVVFRKIKTYFWIWFA